jgi:hypothetical protein
MHLSDNAVVDVGVYEITFALRNFRDFMNFVSQCGVFHSVQTEFETFLGDFVPNWVWHQLAEVFDSQSFVDFTLFCDIRETKI